MCSGGSSQRIERAEPAEQSAERGEERRRADAQGLLLTLQCGVPLDSHIQRERGQRRRHERHCERRTHREQRRMARQSARTAVRHTRRLTLAFGSDRAIAPATARRCRSQHLSGGLMNAD